LWNGRNRFRILSENAPFGIILIDKEGVFQYFNPKFKELFGYHLDEVPNSYRATEIFDFRWRARMIFSSSSIPSFCKILWRASSGMQ